MLNPKYDVHFLTLSWRRPLSYRNQSIDLLRNGSFMKGLSTLFFRFSLCTYIHRIKKHVLWDHWYWRSWNQLQLEHFQKNGLYGKRFLVKNDWQMFCQLTGNVIPVELNSFLMSPGFIRRHAARLAKKVFTSNPMVSSKQ